MKNIRIRFNVPCNYIRKILVLITLIKITVLDIHAVESEHFLSYGSIFLWLSRI